MPSSSSPIAITPAALRPTLQGPRYAALLLRQAALLLEYNDREMLQTVTELIRLRLELLAARSHHH